MKNAYHLFLADYADQGYSHKVLSRIFNALTQDERRAYDNRARQERVRASIAKPAAAATHVRRTVVPKRPACDAPHITAKTRIAVWWEKEKEWFLGTIGPTTATGRNYIAYDDGDGDGYLYLPQEMWKYATDEDAHLVTHDDDDTECAVRRTVDMVVKLCVRKRMSLTRMESLLSSVLTRLPTERRIDVMVALCDDSLNISSDALADLSTLVLGFRSALTRSTPSD